MTPHRIIIEVEASHIHLVQLMASSLRQLASQVAGSDLMAAATEEFDHGGLLYTGKVAIEERPPQDWQPREYRDMTRLIADRRRRDAWQRMLELQDFEVDD